MRQIRTSYKINNFIPHYLNMYSYATLKWLAQRQRQILDRMGRNEWRTLKRRIILMKNKKKNVRIIMKDDFIFYGRRLASPEIYPFYCNRAIVLYFFFFACDCCSVLSALFTATLYCVLCFACLLLLLHCAMRMCIWKWLPMWRRWRAAAGAQK